MRNEKKGQLSSCTIKNKTGKLRLADFKIASASYFFEQQQQFFLNNTIYVFLSVFFSRLMTMLMAIENISSDSIKRKQIAINLNRSKFKP
jgi:hypothetical protein